MRSLEELIGIKKKTPLQKADLQKFGLSGINLFIKRKDLVHPDISGNKWFKLKYNLQEVKKNNIKTILTFGGAYSNHIYAVAAVGYLLGIKTIGVIRGEEHLTLNPTLSFARSKGMNLFYISRDRYRRKDEPEFINYLKNKFGEFYLVPEGGTNQLALKGGSEIVSDISVDFDSIIVPVGTGGTLSGITYGLNQNQNVVGISVLKSEGFINQTVSNLINQDKNKINSNWQIIFDYHFGGYAKFNPSLINFINYFKLKTGIPLDPIYTGKMMFGIFDLIKKDFFRKDSTIIAIHTGGLQGVYGFNQRFGRNLINLE